MRTILVDDEPEIIEHLQHYMAQVPEISDIAVFTDPMEALEYTKKQHVDVAFLDIEMYGMNGIELAMRLKGIKPKINVIFVTGYEHYALDAIKVYASDYLLKPATAESIQAALENLRHPVLSSNIGVRIQTFGNFEVFIDGKPLQISREKPRELLAYLVDKRGTSVTMAEIAAVLWEDKGYDRSLLKQTQTVVSQLTKILKEAGIEYIIIKGWNKLAVNTDEFECDYYKFIQNPARINTFTGEYMHEYSWAEMTAGMLIQKICK